MLIQYCSDLHLEFTQNKDFLKKYPLQAKGKILLLAGDVVPFSEMEKYGDFFDQIADAFEQTYWLPGNHEYYGSDAADRSGTFREQIRSNIQLLNNTVIEIEGGRLVFTSLWSHIGAQHQWDIERSLSDYSVIRFDGRRLTVEQVNQFHAESIWFLNGVFKEKMEGTTIVVSHHVPTFFNYPPIYKKSEINEAFGTELFDMINDSGIDRWIYGHHHVNVPEFKIGATSLVTNQLGYVKYKENGGFDRGKVFEI